MILTNLFRQSVFAAIIAAVVSCGYLTSYSLDDLSIIRRYHLDNVKGVQLCAMHRFDDDLYVMSGYMDGLNCFCEYYVKDNKYYVSRDDHASIAQT